MRALIDAGIRRLAGYYDTELGGGRIVAMEGARGIAVLFVFFVHYHALFGAHLVRGSWLWNTSAFLGTIGNCGVDLFFIMSGYLIYGALIRRDVSYFAFVRRRVQRIYPAFLAVLALYIGLSAMFPQENKIHGSVVHAGLYILANVCLLPGMVRIAPIISVAWSLSFEFCFYLTLPLLISLARIRRWEPKWRLIAAVVVWVTTAIILFAVPASAHQRMISFNTGIILYEVTAQKIACRVLRKRGETLAIVLLIIGLTIFRFWQSGRCGPVYVVSAAFFVVCVYAFEYSGVLQHYLSWTPLRCLGNMSYSYYLLHGLTLEGIAKILSLVQVKYSAVQVLVVLPVGLVVTICTSSVLFFVVEKRFSLSKKCPQRVVRREERASAEVLVGSP